MRPNEHIYLQALLEGNKKGLNWLFQQYRKPIFHFCLKLLKDQSLAEEATADVFISIWEKRLSIDTKNTIQPFLYKIARDTAYTYLRKVASNERLKQKFLENYPLTDQQHGEWIYLQKEHAAEVDHIIDALPSQRQMIFRMRYFDGKDNPSIAKELELSIHTVKSQLVKGRAFVRLELERLGLANVCVVLGLFFMD